MANAGSIVAADEDGVLDGADVDDVAAMLLLNTHTHKHKMRIGYN